MLSRSKVATECLGFSAPIQRWQCRKPGTRWRSGMCSVSYQSLNSSSATFEKSIAAIRIPFAIVFPPRSASSPCYAAKTARFNSTRGARRLGRHVFVGEFAQSLFRLVQIKAHRTHYVRRLGELDIAVFDDFD